MGCIRVAVVDEQPLFRDGVVGALAGDPEFQIVAQGDCAADAIRIAREYSPSVVMLDIHLPGDAISAISTLSSSHPQMKIVVLTRSEVDTHVIGALKAGAFGYIEKLVTRSELARALRAVYGGLQYVTPALASRILLKQLTAVALPTEFGKLSDWSTRERQIVQLVAQGLRNKQVADELGLSENTVKHYVTIIMRKMKVRSRTEIILTAGVRIR